jgi:hypothetical protein
MLPSTTERVTRNTPRVLNEKIRRQTELRVAECAAGGLDAIERRLAELDREWDIERVLEANAASLSVVGTLLGLFRSRRFLILPAAVGGFLLQHALQGWCPPVPLLRRLGVRTQTEIEVERYALKALRGDFVFVRTGRHGNGADDALHAAYSALSAVRR